MACARETALYALVRIERDGAYLNLVLDEALAAAELPPRERALCSALVRGVIERKITLDYLLARHLKKPPARLDIEVLCILRMGVYQLFYLDSIPDSAAVNESVKLCRRAKKTSATGLVNGVLRASQRQGMQLEKKGTPREELSLMLSAPLALINCLCENLGEENARKMLQNALCPAPLFCRVNTAKTTTDKLIEMLASEGVRAAPIEGLPNALNLSGVRGVEQLGSHAGGLFHIQDISSQKAALALGAQEGMNVLDVCAAPGGKSFTIAQQMNNTGCVYACDLYPQRVRLIEQGAARLGLTQIKPMVKDATEYTKWNIEFDRILCDVPCSGLGILRRKPEMKYKPLSEAASLPGLQYKILANAAQYLKRGGVLVYSTCTVRREENGALTKRFLSENPAFSPLESDLLGGWEKTFIPLSGEDGDGFYIALLQKRA